MTIRDLRKIIESLPEDMEVVILLRASSGDEYVSPKRADVSRMKRDEDGYFVRALPQEKSQIVFAIEE